MAFVKMIDEQELTVGERILGPFAIPANVKGVHVRNTRIGWPDTGSPVMSVSIDISLDSGVTWINDFVGWSSHGGAIISEVVKFGDIPGCTAGRFSIPTTGNHNRRVRIHINIATPITTTFDFEVY